MNYKLSTSNKMVFDIFKKLRSDKQLFDLELVVDGGKKFQAHKFLVCAFSPFLHKMLVGKDNRSSVRFNDVTAFNMESILKLIYEQRVEIPEAARMDKALKLFGIDCTVTGTNNRTLVYMLVVNNDDFAKMKKSLWTKLHKPDVTLFSQCGQSIPVHFSVLYLHCRRYRMETSILQDTVDVLPETVPYDALMDAIQLIYTGKLKSDVDIKHLQETFAFLGIASKDAIQICDSRLRSVPNNRAAAIVPIENIHGSCYNPFLDMNDWDDEYLYGTNPSYSVQDINYQSPYAYTSARSAPQTIRVNNAIAGNRFVAPNTAQNVDDFYSRDLTRNIHLTARLNGPASNANGSGPTSNAFLRDFLDTRSTGIRSAIKKDEQVTGDDASRKFFNRFA